MASNRHTSLSFGDLRELPLLQLPYQQLDEMLGSQQAQILTTKSLADKAPKYIQDSIYATQTASQINEYQANIKKQLTDIAATGNTKQYLQALSQAGTEIANLYRPGGIGYNLEQDYKTYTEDVAAKQKALSEGKIKPWQYQTATEDALVNYDSAKGTKRYTPIAKREAIDVNKLANDFVKNYEDNQYNKGELQIINGHVYHRNREISGVDAERVLQGLSAALKNAMFETGELEDLFKTQNKDNAIISDYRKSSLDEAQSTIDLLSKTNTKDEKEVIRLQEELNKYGANIEVDGKYGPQTQKAMDMARNSANEVVGNLSTVDDASLFEKAKDKYVNQYVQQLAAPFAQAKAHQKEKVAYTDMHETMGQWMAKEDYKSKLKKEEDANMAAIVPIMPSSKAVPKDVQYYVQDGKLKKNTNASADATKLRGQDGSPFPFWETANNVLSFFDRLFTDNDTADFSDPMLNNVREHMAANVPGFWNMDEPTQMEMVAKEIDRQSKESLGGNFTANTNSKLKENYDKIFGAVKYDKDGALQYDPGVLPNFKVTTREGNILSGQKFLDEVKDGKYGDKAGISYKGTIDDWTSPLPYGTTIMGVGNTEVHVEPDVESTKRPEAWANGLWRAKQNTGIGHTSNFKYFGNDYTAIYKPDGTYQVKQEGTNTWETVVEQIDPKTGQTNFVKLKK